jgi:type IV pilus assembly protein PilV
MFVKSIRPVRRRKAGFTLVELLVTMLIVSVGILGIVKLEAAGVSESQVSRVRSLMTYQAESLASSMRANRGYWASTTAAFSTWTSVATGTQSYPISGNAGDATCMANTCSSTEMAYADWVSWRTAFVTAFPNATATVACSGASPACTAGSGVVPRSYDITLSWSEKSVAVNRSGNSTASAPVSMVLHVQP